jgi:hypothetical protein
VLGDERKLYVPEEMIAVYRDEVIPYADMLFPNQTEVEYVLFVHSVILLILVEETMCSATQPTSFFTLN